MSDSENLEINRYQTTLWVHSVLLFFITVGFSFSMDSIIFEGAIGRPHEILLMFGLLGLFSTVQIIPRDIKQGAVVSVLLADLVVLWVVARATGGSASPFLFTFPVIALVSSAIFTQKIAAVVLVLTLIFQTISIGFLPTAATSLFATIGTTSLGFYLVRNLSKSKKELKASESSRKRLETIQRAILTHIPSGLLSVDHQRRIILCNSVGLKILGYTDDQIQLKSIDSIFPGLPLNEDFFMKTEKRGEDRPLLEYLSPDGEQLKLGYSVAPLSDTETGEGLGALFVFQDLTQIVKLEENLRLSEKLAAVGKLAAGIAHEIRNPLAGISGSAQLLLGHPQLSEEDNKLLSIIQKESHRLDTLITEFLDYVRPPQPKLEPVDIREIVSHVVESLKVNTKWQLLKSQIHLELGNSSLKNTSADANKVTQVLMNLVLNSGQASAKNVSVVWSADTQRLCVGDDGKGISVENQKRLFEPFFTTKESGTGLGLATSYKVLEAMGARISVESPNPLLRDSPTPGTLFTIEFKKA